LVIHTEIILYVAQDADGEITFSREPDDDVMGILKWSQTALQETLTEL
jgi:hypothetical protein